MESITEDELTKLRNSKSEDEWNRICDDVKDARDGQYPQDWYAKVMMSGLAYLAKSNWK